GSVWLLLDKGGVNYDIRKNLHVRMGGDELFTLPASLISDLNKEVVSATLVQEFKDYGVTLSSKLQVFKITENVDWILLDTGVEPNVSYSINVQSDAYVYRGSTLLFNLPAGLLSWKT